MNTVMVNRDRYDVIAVGGETAGVSVTVSTARSDAGGASSGKAV